MPQSISQIDENLLIKLLNNLKENYCTKEQKCDLCILRKRIPNIINLFDSPETLILLMNDLTSPSLIFSIACLAMKQYLEIKELEELVHKESNV